MSWWGQILRAIGWESPAEVPVGSGGATAGTPVGPSYSPHKSVSSFAAFPWVRACVDAYINDMRSLPLVLVRGEGKNQVTIDNHPVLDLLKQPTSYQTRAEWEAQLILFLLLNGSVWTVAAGKGRKPTSLPVLHPEGVKVVSGSLGEPVGVEWRTTGGDTHYYAIEDVIGWQLPAWERGDQGLLGEGLIRCLSTDLTADIESAKMTAKAASRGRPDAVISPKGDDVMWDEDTRKSVAKGWAALAAGGSPVVVLGGASEVVYPHYTPRDMEYAKQRGLTRETVLAVFGAPPHRVGLPQANYATAQQAEKRWWSNVIALAERLDAGYTRIAKRFDPSLSVRHDFSGVEALQESRDSRLARVQLWVGLGASKEAAAAYEGFTDAPISDAEVEQPAEQSQARAVNESLPWLAKAPKPTLIWSAAAASEPEPEPDDPAGIRWRGWLDEVYSPAEKRLARAVKRALAAQGQRVAARVPATVGRDLTSALVDLVLDAIYPVGEGELFAQDIRPELYDTIAGAMRRASEQVGVTFSPVRADALTRIRLASMVTHTTPTTREALRVLVENALSTGMSANDLQAAIQQDHAFSPARSLLIARTEATAGTNEAALVAWRDAEASGVKVKKRWLSARMPTTRDEHVVLDGQERMLGEMFVVPMTPGLEYGGSKGLAPGGFPEAGMVCNCVCTVEPVLEDS